MGSCADAAHQRFRGRGEVIPIQQDGTARDPSASGQQPQHGRDGGGLAGPGLAHDGYPLAAAQVQADAVQHRRSGEADLEVTDGQQRFLLIL
jgi:hypothetical protein